MTPTTLEALMGKKEKVACKNCREPTTFDSNAHYQRARLVGADRALNRILRATVDEETGKKRWWDDEKASTDWTGFNPPGRR